MSPERTPTPSVNSRTTNISDGNSPWNEALSFSPQEFAALKIRRPDLFDTERSPQERLRLWKAYAYTREGAHHRWR
jgi:hypothetical protein